MYNVWTIIIYLLLKKMFKLNFSEIFPSKWSFIVFVTYMSLFVGQGLLVTNSQDTSNIYKYNTVLAVLITELFKLLICLTVYTSKFVRFSPPVISLMYALYHFGNFFYRNSCRLLCEQSIIHCKLLWLYFVPAFLYCLYNNLSYVNLLNYDPATYFILLQLRVVITGVLFQILFSKMLTCMQWFSLILLTVGCMTKNFNFETLHVFYGDSRPYIIQAGAYNSSTTKSDGMGFNYNTSLIILQVLCSCFAGVYSEYLLKSRGLHVDIFIQNVFLYFDSIVCNVMVLVVQQDTSFFSKYSLDEITHPMVLLVILNNAIIGIVTSFFLKYLNSILKTVASALELIFITIFSWILFNVPIKFNTFISIAIILLSIVIYSRNPVQNPERMTHKKVFTDNV